MDSDPGERRNVARSHPDVVGEMRARLAAALANTPAADAAQATATATAVPFVHLRFAGGGRAHDVSGVSRRATARHPATIAVEPAGIARDAFRVLGGRVDFAITTFPDAPVGFDVRVDPPGAPVAWKLFLDENAWPERATFAGPFGLPAVAAAKGIATGEARAEVYAATLPVIDPVRDLGVFVTRDSAERSGEPAAEGPPTNGLAAKEMQRVLKDWGYAH